jgi:hypothetical protein
MPLPLLVIALIGCGGGKIADSANYSCLGHVRNPAPTASTIGVFVRLTDVSNDDQPAANVSVRACAKSDAECVDPVFTGTTDSTGTANLTLPITGDGFDGYADCTGSSASGAALMEELVFGSQPVVEAGEWFRVTIDTAANQQRGWPAVIDPSRAQMIVVAYACLGTDAFGASLAVSAADQQTMLAYDGPDGLSTTDTTFPEWQNNALAYVANIPGTSTTVTTTYQGQRVGSMDVALRPGIDVVAYLGPTP